MFFSVVLFVDVLHSRRIDLNDSKSWYTCTAVYAFRSLSNCMQIFACIYACVWVCVCLPAYLGCEGFIGSDITLHVYWLIMKNGETIFHLKQPQHCHIFGQDISAYKYPNPSLKVKIKKLYSDYNKQFKFSPN